MKSKVTVWGKDKSDKRVLLALALIPEENLIDVYAFPEESVSAEFENLLNNEWKNDHEIFFPEGFDKQTVKLTASDRILPEGYSTDQEDLLNRLQTEWQFRVLSSKLRDSYKSELDLIRDKIDASSEFSQNIWNDLKSTWEKIQQQIRDKYLLADHIDNLKAQTNDLFESLKQQRKELDKVFNEKSSGLKDEFFSAIQSIEDKLNKGLSFQPLFEELKDIQARFNKVKFSNPDRRSVWTKLDNAYKSLKEKRYGNTASSDQAGGNTALDRLTRRYDGLLGAIKKMEKSIQFDEKELEYQHKRINDPGGQLEVQIRQAKVKMTEERIQSKKEKLDEMLKTKIELESKKSRIELSEKARQEKEEAIKLAEEKVAAEIALASAARSEQSDVLEEAARQIVSSVQPSDTTETNNESQSQQSSNSAISNLTETELLLETAEGNADNPNAAEVNNASVNESNTVDADTKSTQISDTEQTAEDPEKLSITEKITHAVEDVVDTFKAVAAVVSNEIDERVEKFNSNMNEEE